MFNKNRQIRSAVSASAKQIHSFGFFLVFFCKETEMSRIGKNEATFKFVFFFWFLISTGDSVRVRNFRLESFFSHRFCRRRDVDQFRPWPNLRMWLLVRRIFANKKKKEMDSSCEIDVVTYSSKKKSPKKKNMLIGVFFSFKKYVYRHLSSWFISPILTSSPDTWNRRQKSKSALCRIPSVLLTILQLSPLYDRIPLWSLTAKCYSLVHLGIEWMYFVNDFGATTKKKQMFNF